MQGIKNAYPLALEYAHHAVVTFLRWYYPDQV